MFSSIDDDFHDVQPQKYGICTQPNTSDIAKEGDYGDLNQPDEIHNPEPPEIAKEKLHQENRDFT